MRPRERERESDRDRPEPRCTTPRERITTQFVRRDSPLLSANKRTGGWPYLPQSEAAGFDQENDPRLTSCFRGHSPVGAPCAAYLFNCGGGRRRMSFFLRKILPASCNHRRRSPRPPHHRRILFSLLAFLLTFTSKLLSFLCDPCHDFTFPFVKSLTLACPSNMPFVEG